MPRNRMVKSTFWVEESVVSCSRDARLLYIGMWNFCDDVGIHPVSYLTLKMEVFPGDDCSVDDIKSWIAELISNDLVREYHVNEKFYWIILGWENRQTINRPTPSHYPPPESDYKKINNPFNLIEHSVMDHDVFTNGSLSDHRELIPNIKERKVIEEKENIVDSNTINKKKTSFPENMTTNDTHKALSDKLGLNVDSEFIKFKEHHQANGNKFVCWDMAFNKWLRKGAEFSQKKGNSISGTASTDIMAGVGHE